MPRVCFFTGRKTKVGRKIRYRGKPKYQGGIGLKITANEKRKFGYTRQQKLQTAG